jgi:hypothetical protein
MTASTFLPAYKKQPVYTICFEIKGAKKSTHYPIKTLFPSYFLIYQGI